MSKVKTITSDDSVWYVECRSLKLGERRKIARMSDREAGIETLYAVLQKVKRGGEDVPLDDLDDDEVEIIADLIAPLYTRKN